MPVTRLAVIALALAAALCAPLAEAKDGIEVTAAVEARAIYSERAVLDGDEIEGSGAGTTAEAGFAWRQGRTAVQFDLAATIFEFTDEARPTRTGIDAAAALDTGLSDTLTLTLEASARDDIVTLEARQTDQASVGAALTFEKDDTRLRAGVEQRWRRYAGAAENGEGLRIDVQANRRLGRYHWARLDLRAEDIDSRDPARGYTRHTARLSYSRPVAGGTLVRLRPALTYTQWTFDDRHVDGREGTARRDRFWQPELGLAYGRSKGWQGRVRAAWQLRHSNDPRFAADAPFAELRVGYAF